MLKKKICDKVREFLSTISLPAVIYAENLVGKGFGDTKKEIAIDFILQKLPSFLLPSYYVQSKLLFLLQPTSRMLRQLVCVCVPPHPACVSSSAFVPSRVLLES